MHRCHYPTAISVLYEILSGVEVSNYTWAIGWHKNRNIMNEGEGELHPVP
jgi:hypothetical protein